MRCAIKAALCGAAMRALFVVPASASPDPSNPDNTLEIQTLLNNLLVTLGPIPDAYIFGTGTYNLNGPIFVPQGVKLNCPNGGTLKFNDPTVALDIGVNGSHSGVLGCNILGNTAQTGNVIAATNGNGIDGTVLKDLHVWRAPGSSRLIFIGGGTSALPNTNIDIENVVLSGGGYGILVDAHAFGHGLNISKFDISLGTGDGIEINTTDGNWKKTSIAHGTISTVGTGTVAGFGIGGANAHEVNIEDVTFGYTWLANVHFEDGSQHIDMDHLTGESVANGKAFIEIENSLLGRQSDNINIDHVDGTAGTTGTGTGIWIISDTSGVATHVSITNAAVHGFASGFRLTGDTLTDDITAEGSSVCVNVAYGEAHKGLRGIHCTDTSGYAVVMPFGGLMGDVELNGVLPTNILDTTTAAGPITSGGIIGLSVNAMVFHGAGSGAFTILPPPSNYSGPIAVTLRQASMLQSRCSINAIATYDMGSGAWTATQEKDAASYHITSCAVSNSGGLAITVNPTDAGNLLVNQTFLGAYSK